MEHYKAKIVKGMGGASGHLNEPTLDEHISKLAQQHKWSEGALSQEEWQRYVEMDHKLAITKSRNLRDAYYPEGTIKTQAPYLKERGFDIEKHFDKAGGIFWGTVNLDIGQSLNGIKVPDYSFEGVQWAKNFITGEVLERVKENFSLLKAWVRTSANDNLVEGLIYYPHQETRPGSTKGRPHVEWVGPEVESVEYGDEVELIVEDNHLVLGAPA